MAVSVLEIGWAANDWPTVEQQLNAVWNIEMAVPLITWMPYAYKTWSSPTPNKDIVLGKYDDYIAQFLGNLSTWVAGKRAYLRFAPQPNGDWFPWSPVCGSCSGNGQSINQTVASYSAMWTYVINKVRSSKYNLGTDVLQVMFDVNNVNAPDSAAGHEFLPTSLTTINWIESRLTGGPHCRTTVGRRRRFQSMFTAMPAARPISLSPFSASTSTPNVGKNTWINLVRLQVHRQRCWYHNANLSTTGVLWWGDLATMNSAVGTHNVPGLVDGVNTARTVQADSTNSQRFRNAFEDNSAAA